MGKVYSHVARFAKNYNANNRAFKELETQAKNPASKIAPKHATTSKFLDEYAKENEELFLEQKTKNEALVNRLKDVRIESKGAAPETTTEKRLPESRRKMDTPEFGYTEPTVIPKGKVSIRQATDFISHHTLKPQEYTSEDIAKQYNLDHHQVLQVLKHFKYFRIHLPKKLVDNNPDLVHRFKEMGPNILETSDNVKGILERVSHETPKIEYTEEVRNLGRVERKHRAKSKDQSDENS